jgi:ATP-dependent DNA helicase RecG
MAVYKDRIEISNPGAFPEGRTPEEYIEKECGSILRNPLIANTLFLSKDIEKWGSGIRRIYDACTEADVKVEFRSKDTGFSVVFYRPERTVPENVPENVPEKRLEKILENMSKDERVTIPSLARLLGVNEKTIKRDIERLKAEGRLKRIGPDKGGRWEVRR